MTKKRQRNSTTGMDRYELIVEPRPDGSAIVGIRAGTGLDHLMESDPNPDGWSLSYYCGGCARELLATVLRDRPSLHIGQATSDGPSSGYVLLLKTAAEKRSLIDRLGCHVH
jgi:hypothetical protein